VALTMPRVTHNVPYQLVIGDDRVRDTREQMMLLQVVLVKLSDEAGIAWEFYYFMVLK